MSYVFSGTIGRQNPSLFLYIYFEEGFAGSQMGCEMQEL
jgi:hypothetical protein